jgi:GT2 family glycosyltransferase
MRALRMSGGIGPVWVGLLDLDGDGPVTDVSGPVRRDHCQARVLIRMHRAPIGFVWVPAHPEHTLTERARAAAGSALAGALHRHAELDRECSQAGPGRWEARITCPARFPAHGGKGITVVVPTRDRPDLLADSVRTLQQVAYDPMEILIVDNAPRDDATRETVLALAADDPRVRYTCEPRPGRSRACNHGLAQAKFEIVAMTDDDTLTDPGWLSAIAAAFAADPGTVCVTGMVASSALGTGPERYFDARYTWGKNFQPGRYDLAGHRHPSPFYPFAAGIYGTGANCAFRRDFLARIGGFDPLLGAGGARRGGADLDVFLRVILAGGRITYLPSALIWHRHRPTHRALSQQLYAYGHGLGAYVAKHLQSPQLRRSLLIHGPRHAAWSLGRQRVAAHSGQLGVQGVRLALYEACGVIPGAVRYWLAALKAAQHPGRRQ